MAFSAVATLKTGEKRNVSSTRVSLSEMSAPRTLVLHSRVFYLSEMLAPMNAVVVSRLLVVL